MNSKTFSALVQILTLVAVGIGAALVVYELRQTQDLARVQLYSDGFGLALQNINTLIGEDSAPIITKACLEPEKLTTAEKYVLQFFYFRQIQTIGRIRAISQISDVYPEGTWRNTPALDPIFRTAIGRAWWHSSTHRCPESRSPPLRRLRYARGWWPRPARETPSNPSR